MKLFSTLQSNILLIIFISLISSLLILGFALDLLVRQQFSHKTEKEFSVYINKVKDYLINLENDLKFSGQNFIKDKKLLSKIDFISTYATPENYNKIIYDPEKKKLAKKAYDFIRIAQFHHVKIYDKDGEIIAYADNSENGKQYGLLSYDSKQPEINSFLSNDQSSFKYSLDHNFWAKSFKNTKENLNKLFYIEDEEGFHLSYSLALKNEYIDGETSKIIGYIQITQNIGNQLLNQSDIDEQGFKLLISETGKHLGQNPLSLTTKNLHYAKLLELDVSKRIQTEIEYFDNYLFSSHQLFVSNNSKVYLVFALPQNLIDDEVMQIRLVSILVFIIAIIFSLSIAVFYHRRFTQQSIQQIITYADKIKAGRYQESPPNIREEELRHISDILHLASHTIQDREKDLRNAHNDLEQKVIIRTKEFLQAKEEAEKANLAKSQFLSSMSHELRTPLNAILGFSQLIQLHDKDQNTLSNVDEILTAGYHLLELVNQILDLSKIESGQLNIEIEEIQLNSIIQESISHIESATSSNFSVSISFNQPEDNLTVLADKVRLRQVLLNLMSNAVKYNKTNGTVTISVEKNSQEMAVVSIIDTGFGIDEDKLKLIFEPFERLNFKNGKIEGSGIGLTVTKQIVEAMNGKVGVNSTIGEGSHFWVSLPLDTTVSSA